MKNLYYSAFCFLIFCLGCKTKPQVSKVENPDSIEVIAPKVSLQITEASFQKEIGGSENEPAQEFLYLSFNKVNLEGVIFEKVEYNGFSVELPKTSEKLKVDVTSLKLKVDKSLESPVLFFEKNNLKGTQKIDPILIKEPLYRP